MFRNIIFILLFTSSNLISQWQEIEIPKGKVRLTNIVNVNDVFIAYSTNTFYSSSDKGVTWNKILTTGLDSLINYNDVYVKDNDIYVLSSANGYQEVGLYKSTDYCKTFNRIINDQIKDIVIKENEWYYISTNLYKSTNFGKISDTLFDFFINERYTNLDLTDDKLIMYDKGSRGSNPPITNNGILYSEDKGKTWIEWNDGLVKNRYLFSDVHFTSKNSLIATDKGLFISNEIGGKWEPVNLPHFNINLTSVELVEDTIYIGSKVGEVYKSNNLGETWDLLYINSNFRDIKNITNINNEIYFTNIGLQKINNNEITEINIKDNVLTKSLFYDNNKYCLFTLHQGFFYKNDLTSTWEILNDSLYNFGFDVSEINMKDSLIIANVFENIIKVSNDLGKTWKDTTLGESDDNIYKSFIFDSVIMITTRFNLYYSYDKGKNFVSFRENNPDFNYSMRDIYFDGKTYYATSFNTGILKSTDNGYSWKESHISPDSPISYQTTFKLTINDNILVATEHDPFTYLSNSVFISSDKGETWKNNIFTDNEVYIYDMINYKDNIFIISTDGFIYSKDNGETWLDYNLGIEGLKLTPISYSSIKELKRIKENIYLVAKYQIFTIPLSELGIEYTSVDKTELRNFLLVDPAYPNPVDEKVIIKFQWDISIPFLNSNIEIYNMNGSKVDIKDKMKFERETNYSGKIVWDTSLEKAGVYLIKIKHGNAINTEKIIIK